MQAYYYESSSYNPWENLATEKYLADRIGKGDILLYLWQNDRTVVIGRNQNALRECRGKLLEEEGGYLARRTTGGGAVYHDLGNLCFTFAADPELYDLQRQMKVIGRACRMFGIETTLSGRNDLITSDGFKFSGNAFSVTSSCKLQHGTLMINVDTSQLARYLTPSKEKMKAKGITSVRSRVCNLSQLNPNVTVAAMVQALKEAFAEEYGDFAQIQDLDVQHTSDPELVAERDKYSSWEWRYGKSPQCEVTYEHRFDWGEVQLLLTLKEMHIAECRVYSDCLDTEFPALLEKAVTGKRYDLQDLEIPEGALGAEEANESAANASVPAAVLSPESCRMLSDVKAWMSSEELNAN